jgi:hypothetical protein
MEIRVEQNYFETKRSHLVLRTIRGAQPTRKAGTDYFASTTARF